MPEPDEVILGGDLLLLQGRTEDLNVLVGLQELTIRDDWASNTNIFESARSTTASFTCAVCQHYYMNSHIRVVRSPYWFQN